MQVRWGGLGGRILTGVRMESELFFLSSNPGVIYSFLVVGRNGFSKVLLGLQENR